MFFDRFGYHGTSFEQTYRCYPASFIDKPQIESGDKIIMPPSALDRLASLHIDYPMLFELRNESTSRVSHCGVLEFIAEEGVMYMPYWMMENMLLQEGDIVMVKNVTLPKGTYVKLQPHTMDFLDISNPKAILETSLRNFSCLTTGDIIMVAYNNKKYYIDIVESKPSAAITIIETDCEVDFAPPLDYKEPETKPTPTPTQSLDPEGPEDRPQFNVFTGVGRRLDGKPVKEEEQAAAQVVHPTHTERAKGAEASSNGGCSRKTNGKLVFGSSSGRVGGGGGSVEGTQNVKKGGEIKEAERDSVVTDKFQPFTGRKYSLRG